MSSKAGVLATAIPEHVAYTFSDVYHEYEGDLCCCLLKGMGSTGSTS